MIYKYALAMHFIKDQTKKEEPHGSSFSLNNLIYCINDQRLRHVRSPDERHVPAHDQY